ncbi:MAG TPA: hypothetical protein VHF70_05410, partial [Rubrobacteraceae bacterium]|nr:hypothetical protein [Rubrobacteraceae bacterium]
KDLYQPPFLRLRRPNFGVRKDAHAMLHLLAVRHRSNQIVSIFVLSIFLAASAGAGTIVLGAMPVGGIPDPNRFICLAWGAVICVIVFVLPLSGGSTRSGRQRSWSGAVRS